MCVIDGDRLIFNNGFIEQGYQGGRKAAQDFTKAIAQELVEQGLTGFERLSFWVTIYTNKRAVLTWLREDGIATPEQFEAFLTGFGQASPRFVVVDVGLGVFVVIRLCERRGRGGTSDTCARVYD